MTSLPMSPPWLSAALLPFLVLCGYGPCPHPTTPASPLLVHPTSDPLQVGLTCKNIPAFFFELVIYYFYQMVQAKHG